MAAMVMQLLDAQDVRAILPGIGVKSHYGLTFDLVPIGPSMCGKHDELLVVCMCLISVTTGRAYSPMICAPAISFAGKTGQGTADQVEESLRLHPSRIDQKTNRNRCAGIGGDGGVTKGGSMHRHRSTAAAEILWGRWHPDSPLVCTIWDRMHQGGGPQWPFLQLVFSRRWAPWAMASTCPLALSGDLAFWRAVKESTYVTEVFDVAKELEYTFNMGRGGALFRAVAARPSPEGGKAKKIISGGGIQNVLIPHMGAAAARYERQCP